MSKAGAVVLILFFCMGSNAIAYPWVTPDTKVLGVRYINPSIARLQNVSVNINNQEGLASDVRKGLIIGGIASLVGGITMIALSSVINAGVISAIYSGANYSSLAGAEGLVAALEVTGWVLLPSGGNMTLLGILLP